MSKIGRGPPERCGVVTAVRYVGYSLVRQRVCNVILTQSSPCDPAEDPSPLNIILA